MYSMKNRVVILVVAIAMIAGLLACGPGGLLSRTEATATPTKTPKPTFTITPTPTQTPIPTNTPLPTDTATPTPEATNTPVVHTATPTETPTNTPEPTATPVPPTNTPKPKPPKPKPTATKIPAPTSPPPPSFPFTGSITGGTVNCGSTGVRGKITTRTGGNYAGVTVAVWTDGWEGTVSYASDHGGNWNVLLGPDARPGTWYVAVVQDTTCQPKPDGNGWTALGCDRQSNVITVTTTAHCEGEGAVQWPEVGFRQN